ncbi:type 1 fimbrial protein [Moellerella wisconsensis]|uniref:fimbrial protein n=1 Tax=Moellerella wisconsensis TaxID=158849 RepID=UPI001F4EC0AF|nr:fimbrial protein [Moellerella wisconsensis]UNH43407.1 type 1 fimbrial protein [Moellerella wisconsensis]
MKLSNKVILAPIAAVVLFSSVANANNKMTIDFTGQISSATCDVDLGISGETSIDLGWIPMSDFIMGQSKYLEGGNKNFEIALTQCQYGTQVVIGEDGQPATETVEGKGEAELKVTGTTLSGTNEIFSSASTGSNGVILYEGTSANTPVTNNQGIKLSNNGTKQTVAFTAKLASKAKENFAIPSSDVKAPITFTYTYN